MIKRLFFSVENCTMMKKIFRKKNVKFPGLKFPKTTEITSCTVSETFFTRKSHANKK